MFVTFKAFVKAASSFEQLIKVWPAIEYSLKGIVIAELQTDLYVNGSYMRSVSDKIILSLYMNWAIGLIWWVKAIDSIREN